MKNGKIFYQGPVEAIRAHFEGVGLPCPHNTNPSDHVMFIIQTETEETLQAAKAYSTPTQSSSDSNGAGNGSPAKDGMSSCGVVDLNVKANFATQLVWLVHRELLNAIRNKPALIGRFGVTIFLNLVFGLIFLKAGSQNDANEDNFNAHQGVLTMTLVRSCTQLLLCIDHCRFVTCYVATIMYILSLFI